MSEQYYLRKDSTTINKSANKDKTTKTGSYIEIDGLYW